MPSRTGLTIVSVKRVPTSLLALGRFPPPETVVIDGKAYRFARLFKHDFFAATSLYVGDDEKIVVKFGRSEPLFGFAMSWIGRFLSWNESRLYEALSDLPAVPRFIGRVGRTAIAHEFVEGAPLSRESAVPDDFFAALRSAIDEMHRRDMAYVDLEKRQNVILGDDGKPYLIDFQLAWHWPASEGGRSWGIRHVRNWFQSGDLYHLLKMHRRVRPDQLSADERERSYRKPLVVRTHRKLTVPLLVLRRAILRRIDPKHGQVERGTIDAP